MKKYFLLTAFGKDRPGIVAGVTQALFDLGGNIEDASMTRLGGEFAMMLVASLPPGVSTSQLEKCFRPLKMKLGLDITAKPIPQAAAHRAKLEPPKYLISVYGADHPGIVSQVAQSLAGRQVSITDLQTKVIGAAQKPVYVMLLELQVPPSVDLDELRAELDRLRQDLKVELTLQDIEAVPL